jgi:hypothetical protein
MKKTHAILVQLMNSSRPQFIIEGFDKKEVDTEFIRKSILHRYLSLYGKDEDITVDIVDETLNENFIVKFKGYSHLVTWTWISSYVK